MNDRPIVGVFDSGVGGLSVVRELLRELPEAEIHYVADSAHCPYGARSRSEIVDYSLGISRYLLDKGADVIVVACNTASAAALRDLRTELDVPFVGMVPAVKPAVSSTRSGVIGVLATPTTLDGRLLKEVVEHYAQGVRVLTKACPGLVEAVETGEIMAPETLALLQACLTPLLDEGIDTLVLGCTHYPFLEPAIRAVVGDSLDIVEPSNAIARQTRHILQEIVPQVFVESFEFSQHQFASTGDPMVLQQSLKALLGIEALTYGLIWAPDGLVRA